ncbi:MAG: hypothetical protein ORN21_02945 [Methylophilaceae bacterium]|nr:hypothetical protein [Methylophilaceae bacterium]
MKYRLLVAVSMLSVAFNAGAWTDGPADKNTVLVPEKFDLSKKELVDVGADVLDTFQSRSYFRTVYSVPEKIRPPQTAYIVEEKKPVQVTEQQSAYVLVDKKDVPIVHNKSTWYYITPKQ